MIRLRYDVLAMVRSASCEQGLRINSNLIKLLSNRVSVTQLFERQRLLIYLFTYLFFKVALDQGIRCLHQEYSIKI